jgi:hypothetical protein
MVSFTVRPPSAPFRPSPLGNGHRAGAPSRKLFEANDEEEDEDRHRSRERNGNGDSRRGDERVDGFSNGRSHGCVSILPHVDVATQADNRYRGEKPVEPLVIAAIPNKDWRQSSTRRAPAYRPDVPKREEEDGQPDRVGDGPQRSGLRVHKPEEGGEIRVKVERTVEVTRDNNGITRTEENVVSVKREPMTLEEQALAAILAGEVKQETADERLQRELVIDMSGGSGAFTPLSEQDALKRDMVSLPEEVRPSNPPPATQSDGVQSTLDDYETIPVSAFGLAMARGMGWDPKSSEGTAIHEPKMRPQLLGLGATPMDTTIKPTHGKSLSSREKEKKKAERATRGGKGFVPTGLMVKREKEGSGTPSGSRRESPEANGGEGSRRKREDGDDSDRDSKRRERERDSDRGEGSSKGARDYRHGSEYEDGTREGSGPRNGGERDRNGERSRYDDRETDMRRDREYETEEERARRKAREKERDRERDGKSRYDDRDRRDRSDRDESRGKDTNRNGDDRDRRRNRERRNEKR